MVKGKLYIQLNVNVGSSIRVPKGIYFKVGAYAEKCYIKNQEHHGSDPCCGWCPIPLFANVAIPVHHNIIHVLTTYWGKRMQPTSVGSPFFRSPLTVAWTDFMIHLGLQHTFRQKHKHAHEPFVCFRFFASWKRLLDSYVIFLQNPGVSTYYYYNITDLCCTDL